MSRLLRAARSWTATNSVVRAGVRGLIRLGDWARADLAPRWGVSGDVDVEIAGVPVRMRSRCDDPLVSRFYFGIPWERSELRVWRAIAPHASRVVDVGANTGAYALLAARVRGDARIVALEPHPANYERLVSNVEINGARGIEPVRAAVGDSSGRITFRIPANGQIIDTSSAVAAFADAHYGIRYVDHSVEQVTLDDVVRDRLSGDVDLVKIDVEYYEQAVLAGARWTLSEPRPVILIEAFDYDVFTAHKPELTGKIDPESAPRVGRILSEAGYAIYAVGERGLLRVESLINTDPGSNYLATPVLDGPRYVALEDVAAIEALARRATRRART